MNKQNTLLMTDKQKKGADENTDANLASAEERMKKEQTLDINYYQGKDNLLKHIKIENNNEGVNNSHEDITEDDEKIAKDKELEKKYIEEIKSKLAEFFNIKNVHFLFGSGTSCNAIPNMSGLLQAVEDKLKVDIEDKDKDKDKDSVGNKISQEYHKIKGRIENKENLEEILGILYSNRIYLDRNEGEEESLVICEELIGVIETTIFDKLNIDFNIDEAKEVLDAYTSFYQKLSMRNRDLSRLNIFTTNNDLFNETALDKMNIHYMNGFGGGFHKFFNPALFNYTFSKRMDTSIDKYEPVDNVVNLFKLHGSVNWIEDTSNTNAFFKIKEIGYPVKREASKETVLIYPTPTKQNKSLGSPYVELFREFQRRLLMPHSVLFVIGYSFSDEHVNNIIYQALATNSSISLVIINNVEHADISKVPDNRIYRIWGSDTNGESIHYFKYIVENLLPNIDHNKTQDELLKSFIKHYNSNISK